MDINLGVEGLSALSKDSWIYKHIQYTSRQESPTKFHIWSALSAVSSALGRKCWMYRGHYLLYPNQYIILVAESARCRKSTAADIVVEDLLETTTLLDILRQKMTAEFLCKALARSDVVDNSVLIYAPELATFLGSSAFQSGIIPLLTGLYNCPSKSAYKTKEKGTFDLTNVCINLLAATTLDWMSSNMPGESIEGGFTGRVIFVVCEEPRFREPWPYLDTSQVEIRDDLIRETIRIHQLRGEFNVTDQAKDTFSKWYMKAKPPDDIRLRGYEGRKGDHVLKVAMCLSAAESNNMTIESVHIDMALKLFNQVEGLMGLAYRGTAFSKNSKDHDRVLRQIEKAGGAMDHSPLLKQNYHYLTAEDFKGVMTTLIEAGDIVELVVGRKRTYKLTKKAK